MTPLNRLNGGWSLVMFAFRILIGHIDLHVHVALSA